MRIAIVVPHFFPTFGGHEFYLARELARLGNDVHVITSDFLPSRYFPRPTKAPPGDSRTDEGFELHRTRTFTDIHNMPTFDPRRTIHRIVPDIIYAQEYYQLCSLLSFMAAKEMRAPFVFAQHMYEPPRGPLRVAWKGASMTMGAYVAGGAARVVAISRAARALLLSLGIPPEKIAVVPLGVDTAEFGFAEAGEGAKRKLGLAGRTVILYVGRLDPVKGMDVLLRAFASVSKTRPETVLVIKGTGTLGPSLMELSKRLGISDSTKFISDWPRADLPELYAACDVFVLPSVREAFGLVGLEAMSTGRAVVASRVGGIQDFVVPGETGLLARPGDPVALADALAAVLDDDELRRRMGRRGRELAEKEFSYLSVAQKTLSVFRQAVDSGGRGGAPL